VFEEELPQLARIDPTMSLAAKSLGSDPTQWSEGLWLLLPFVFVTVATVRRRFWRSVGVVWAAGLAFVELKWTSVPWQEDYVSPCPAEFLWYGPPIALLAAFLLLPPRREAVTPAA
jgi:hypothetical protein